MNKTIVKLGGGLNTAESPLGMPPGNVIGSENYECRIDGGYTSLGGYEPQDGRADPSTPNYVVLGAASWAEEAVIGATVEGVSSGATGVIAYVDSTVVALVDVTGTFEEGERVFVGSTDEFLESVVLLVVGGDNASTTILDRSPNYGDSVTITAGAAFSSGQQVFGANMIAGSIILPTVGTFTSAGAGSRFSRAAGEPITIELYVRWNSLPNTAPSGALFKWLGPTAGNILDLHFYANTGGLGVINGSTNEGAVTTLTADVTHFIQATISASDVLTIDVDGVQVYSSAASSDNTAGTYTVFVTSNGTANATAATYWATPLRWTKNVARARGSVPVEAFEY